MKKIVLAVFMAAMALSLSAQINFREGGFAEALGGCQVRKQIGVYGLLHQLVRSLQIDGV